MNVSIIEMQRYIPLDSTVKISYSDQTIGESVTVTGKVAAMFSNGLISILPEDDSLNYIRIKDKDISSYSILKRNIEMDKFGIKNSILEQIERLEIVNPDYLEMSFDVFNHLHCELFEIAEVIDQLRTSRSGLAAEAVDVVADSIHLALANKSIKGNSRKIIHFLKEAGLHTRLTHKLISLFYYFDDRYLDALDAIRRNLSSELDSSEWYLLAAIYKKLNMIPKCSVYYAIKKSLETGDKILNDNDWKIFMHLCSENKDYASPIHILDQFQSNDAVDKVSTLLIIMLKKSKFNNGRDAEDLFLKKELFEKLKIPADEFIAYLKAVAASYMSRDSNNLYSRYEAAIKQIVNEYDTGQLDPAEFDQQYSDCSGILFEYTGSQYGFVLGYDLICYFVHANSFLNKQILARYSGGAKIEECMVSFNKNRNTRKKFEANRVY